MHPALDEIRGRVLGEFRYEPTQQGPRLALCGVTVLQSQFLHVLVPMVVYMAGVGLALPQSMAGALTPFPERAGAASSVVACCSSALRKDSK